MNTKSELTVKPTIVVMGAGAAGISSALELAARGYHVDLIEQNTLGSGSSGRNPGRMGHGFHYVDIKTAILYLQSSIQVQRKYPGYLIGEELDFDHPVRHGRYFIMKDSDHPTETILHTYEAIRSEYKRLIAEDKDNQVFGPPEQFFRILEPHEYADHVNYDLVDIGIETAEHLFNWQRFATDIKVTIQANPNITLYENTKIENITRGAFGEERFHVHTRNGDVSRVFKSDYLVNSTWQNIEYLNDKIGLPMEPESRTNRLKTLLKITLPESLRNANSMFFCMGQHCMMSNLGNGQAMMTYARVTNMDASCDLTLNENTQRLLNGGATPAEKDNIAKQMLEGVAHYIPEMANAVVDDVLFGIVQTKGKLTLEQLANKHSSFHKRNYSGVREEQIGVISNPCIKLFYFVNNGQITADLIETHINATKVIKQCMVEIERRALEKNIALHPSRHAILKSLDRRESSSLLSVSPSSIVNAEIDRLEKTQLPVTPLKTQRYRIFKCPSIYSKRARRSFDEDNSNSETFLPGCSP